MSLFNDASLVMIPSGYKEDVVYSVKPTDGSGDLTFTRASDGTRVNSDGYIERVPWNLLQQSNTFSTTWVIGSGLSLTSGQSGYDGSSDAWEYSDTLTGNSLGQNCSTSGVQTLSIYAKAGTADGIRLRWLGGSSGNSYFNIADSSTEAYNTTNTIQTKKESIGNGWFRVSLTFNDSVNTIRIYVADGSTTSSVSGNIYIQDAQLNEGTTAKPYFPTTDRQNVPRLDYSNGCPSLLLEPQRTNLALYSEEFDSGSWIGTAISITANTTISPDGTNNADTILIGIDASDARHRLLQSQTITIGTTYTGMYYLKANEHQWIQIIAVSGFSLGVWANFDLVNGTIGNTGGVDTTASIENVGNGWYRCRVSGVATGTSSTGFEILVTDNTNSGRYPRYLSTEEADVCYVWGAQFEQGAYATSYIPTSSTSVTRVADTFTRNNIYTNGLISASGGTWFVELKNNVEYVRDANNGLFLGDSTTINSGNQFAIRNFSAVGVGLLSIVKYISGSGSAIYTATTNNVKIAIKWNGTTADVFANGVKVVSATAFTTTNMENLLGNGSSVPFFIQQMSLFPTPLSDSDCQTLTTI